MKKDKFVFQKGQFFSPDVIIAMGVFVFGLVIFFSASGAVFSQADLITERHALDETMHPVLDSLILSSGVPENWEQQSIGDINSIGLVWKNNCIDPDKLLAFKGLLTDSYSETKQLIGMGRFEFYFSLVDNSGNIVQIKGVDANAGSISIEPKQKLSYQRIVCMDNSEYVFEAVISFEE